MLKVMLKNLINQILHLLFSKKDRRSAASIRPNNKFSRIKNSDNQYSRKFTLKWASLASVFLASLFITSQLVFLNPAYAIPDVCGTPGKENPTVLAGVIDTYYPGTTTVSTGATSIPLGTAQGAPTPITAGDLLLVIQMQDASINSSNNANYGSGTGTGTGFTALNTAGSYQYVVATNNVPLAGGNVTISQPLAFTFTNADADPPGPTAVNGQRRYQVIRVPQYASATIGATVTSYAWDGRVGGVVTFDVAGDLDFNGQAIDVNGQGFRGGGGTNLRGDGTTAAASQNSGYVHPAPNPPVTGSPTATLNNNKYDASKGEGIAGTPRYTRNGGGASVTTVDYTSTIDGYPQGSFSRGAPANAGGGGTDPNKGTNSANTGGGGGANAGAGGKGGDSWVDNTFADAFPVPNTNQRLDYGGLGGTAVSPSVNRIFLGGGGGAGTSNNSTTGNVPSGGGGGGMVMVRSGRVLGTGTISADGIQGVTPNSTDGGGGGGAGGTVLIQSVTAATPTITINARGGAGLNSGFNQHGPGGGGGGGYIAYQGFTPTTNVNPGLAGNDAPGTNGDPGVNAAADPYGAANGVVGIVQQTPIPAAEVRPGALCLPTLTVTKTTSTPTLVKPASGTLTATYTITTANPVTSPAASGTAINVVIADPLPANFTYASTTAITPSGGAVQTSVTNPTAGSTNPTWGTFTIPPGGQVQITFNVTIGSAAPLGTYQNPVNVSYSDPVRTSAGVTKTVSYDSASSTGEDVTITPPTPKVVLVKRLTDVKRGGSSIAPTGAQSFNSFNEDGIANNGDNDPLWPTPNTYLKGAVDGGATATGDRLEYTVYFLSSGSKNVTNFSICDLVPTNTTFVNNTYNGLTPLDTGSTGGNLGMALASSNTVLPTAPTAYASSAIDGDRASFYAAGSIPSPNPCIKEVSPNSYAPLTSADNTNGLIVFNVVTNPAFLPNAVTAGNPTESYGFVRFAVTVN